MAKWMRKRERSRDTVGHNFRRSVLGYHSNTDFGGCHLELLVEIYTAQTLTDLRNQNFNKRCLPFYHSSGFAPKTYFTTEERKLKIVLLMDPRERPASTQKLAADLRKIQITTTKYQQIIKIRTIPRLVELTSETKIVQRIAQFQKTSEI